MGADKPKAPETDYKQLWKNYSGWLGDEQRRGTRNTAMTRAKMAASGLTPGSEAWKQRVAADESAAKAGVGELRGGTTANIIKDHAYAMTGSKDVFKRLWKGGGKTVEGYREKAGEFLADTNKRKELMGSSPMFGSEEHDQRRHDQELTRMTREADRLVEMGDILEKGEAHMAESGIEKGHVFEMIMAGTYGSKTEEQVTEEEASLETARSAGRGKSSADKMRGAGGGAAPGGMTLGMEEEDHSKLPWV